MVRGVAMLLKNKLDSKGNKGTGGKNRKQETGKKQRQKRPKSIQYSADLVCSTFIIILS